MCAARQRGDTCPHAWKHGCLPAVGVDYYFQTPTPRLLLCASFAYLALHCSPLAARKLGQQQHNTLGLPPSRACAVPASFAVRCGCPSSGDECIKESEHCFCLPACLVAALSCSRQESTAVSFAHTLSLAAWCLCLIQRLCVPHFAGAEVMACCCCLTDVCYVAHWYTCYPYTCHIHVYACLFAMDLPLHLDTNQRGQPGGVVVLAASAAQTELAAGEWCHCYSYPSAQTLCCSMARLGHLPCVNSLCWRVVVWQENCAVVCTVCWRACDGPS